MTSFMEFKLLPFGRTYSLQIFSKLTSFGFGTATKRIDTRMSPAATTASIIPQLNSTLALTPEINSLLLLLMPTGMRTPIRREKPAGRRNYKS